MSDTDEFIGTNVMPSILSVAPMMGYTDRYLRYLLRYLSPNSWLYTEMICSSTLLRSSVDRWLNHHPAEHPLVIQIGGSCPRELELSAQIAVQHGFRHLNLNAGCPSPKVQQAGIGACLLRDSTRLRECVSAMRVTGVSTVSVKTRIGVDDQDSFEDSLELADALHKDGCNFLVLHARKAWLKGLSPRQNRTVPPLDYDRVYRLQAELPDLPIILNGGLLWSDCPRALEKCFGVMLGRAVVRDPMCLLRLEQQLWNTPARKLSDIFEHYFDFIDQADPKKWSRAVRHIVSLIRNTPDARSVRQAVTHASDINDCRNICRQYAQRHESLNLDPTEAIDPVQSASMSPQNHRNLNIAV